MQKLIFFIGSNDKDYGLASTIGNLYMNRFSIDEDAGHEIVKIYEGEEFRPSEKQQEFHCPLVEFQKRIGMGHMIFLNF